MNLTLETAAPMLGFMKKQNLGQCCTTDEAKAGSVPGVASTGGEPGGFQMGSERLTSGTVRPFPRTKYIVIVKQGIEVAIISMDVLSHDEMVPRGKDGKELYRVVSSGFCRVDGCLFGVVGDLQVIVSGHSTSLNLQSRPEDADLIRRAL